MASVTSLDKDLRNLRLEKYTPQRARETLQWIESVFGERLSSPDLLEALKDGTALCRLANLVLGQNGVRFKQSAMPFVQMENISHFLRACQSPPLSLPPHDVFLTVDLFEQKDPAQVLQCIGSFSRKAAALQPAKFPTDIAGKKASALSPQSSGIGGSGIANRNPSSPHGRRSPVKASTASPPGASSWSKRSDIGNETPAWNIAQYGWAGGASQGNQGVAFGAPRQIVSQQPYVPSLAEKERTRAGKALELERQKEAAEEERRERERRLEEEERLARQEEARLWDEKTRLQRERDKQTAEEEKRKWEAEERRWKQEEEQRQQEEKAMEAKLEEKRQSRPVLQGQYLSQYQASQSKSPGRTAENDRIKELERQLEEARERERRYESDRLKLGAQRTGSTQAEQTSKSDDEPVPEINTRTAVDDEWDSHGAERSFLRQQWKKNQEAPAASPRPLPVPEAQSDSGTPSRPLPVPKKSPLPTPGVKPISVQSTTVSAPKSPRPLPDPNTYKPPTSFPANRTDAFLATNPAPQLAQAASHTPSEAAHSSSAERATEDSRRIESQNKTKAGGWASKSLLEREMERERERQREWEEAQKATKEASDRGQVDPNAGLGPGQSWDVNSYGYIGGDNLNKSGSGVYAGRRQIIGGPRPMGHDGTK